MIKKIAIGFVVLIVLVAAGGYFVWTNLDHIVKVAVEKYGSQATQTSVRLDSVKLTLQTGEGTLQGLSVANPKDFSAAKALNLGSIGVKLDTNSLAGNGPIVIREVVIDQPQVTYELTGNGDSNLQAIKRNTQAYASAMAGAEANAPASGNAAAGSSRKIIINDLTIKTGQVTVNYAALSQGAYNGKPLSTSLPAIHLTGIGKKSGGATAAEVAEQVLGAIISSAARAGAMEIAKAKLGGVLKNVPAGAAAGAVLNGVTGASATGGIGDQLKGVLGE